MTDKIIEYMDLNFELLYNQLIKLIEFDTQNFISYGNEYDCQKYIETIYRGLGLKTDLFFPDEVEGLILHKEYNKGRGTDKRPNIVGVFRGSQDGSVMIASHTDTMPAGDLSLWKYSPFTGIKQEGRIYGLGSGDNKFGIASAWFAVKALINCGFIPKKTIIIASCSDEEYGGGNGALGLCLKYPCDLYINTDGGNYEIWTAALGGGVFELHIKSNFVSDSVSLLADAVYIAKKEFDILGKALKERLSSNEFYKDSDIKDSAFRILEIKLGDSGLNLDKGKFLFGIYTDKTKDDTFNMLNNFVDKLNQKIKSLDCYVESYNLITRFFEYDETSSKASDLMTEIASQISGTDIKKCGSCLSDLSLFKSCGNKNSFSFGILRDFKLEGGAHQPNEYIDCKQFLDHSKALALFLYKYCN